MLFHGNNGYANAPQCYMYTYTYTAYLVKSHTSLSLPYTAIQVTGRVLFDQLKHVELCYCLLSCVNVELGVTRSEKNID
jgi:hypothetical protein